MLLLTKSNIIGYRINILISYNSLKISVWTFPFVFIIVWSNYSLTVQILSFHVIYCIHSLYLSIRCDRILSYGKGMRQLNYRRTELKLSDHRPVTATYMAEVEVFSHRKLQRALTFTDAEIENDEIVNDMAFEVGISSLKLEQVSFCLIYWSWTEIDYVIYNHWDRGPLSLYFCCCLLGYAKIVHIGKSNSFLIFEKIKTMK